MDQPIEQDAGTPAREPAGSETDGDAADGDAADSWLEVLRDWADALLIAFVLAMFVRIFMVELFKIPSGSMTPTLIGGSVVDFDYNGDLRADMLLMNEADNPLLFLNESGRLVARGPVRLSDEQRSRLAREGISRRQYDRILVNKFAYWFHPPERGDVVVFKVPDVIWKPDKPIYIKRCVGEPGETLTFDADGRLVAGGRRVEEPPFFRYQHYSSTIDQTPEPETAGQIEYEPTWRGSMHIESIHVPRGQIYVFGDNAWSSLDSRYWGGVPLSNVKGKAFFRYFPLNQMKFLNAQ
jgi:signal peptidase I